MLIPKVRPITNKRLAQIAKGRNSVKYREWREYCLNRDEHKCQYPNCDRTDKLEVHHIQKFVIRKDLRTDTLNGIVLCSRCHDMVTSREDRFALMFLKIAFANEKIYRKKLNGDSTA